MTEDKAKTKWCPAFRGNDHGINRPLEMEGLIGRCLGSACMAWRTTARIPLSVAREIQKELSLPLAQAWDHAAGLFIDDGKPDGEDGYCGLAGPPR